MLKLFVAIVVNTMTFSKCEAKIDIIPPKKSAFTIDTAPDFFKLHTLCIASGTRGQGKTTSIVNLVREAYNRMYYDRIIVITPTYHSNKELWDILPEGSLRDEDILEPDLMCLKTTKAIINAEREEWDLFLQQKALFDKFHNDMKHKQVKNIRSEQLMMYYEAGLLDDPGMEKPEWKYRQEVPPRIAVIIDDSVGTDLMNRRSAGLTKFIIAHRHWGKGLGCSVFMLVQSYCCHEGVARAIRENTCLLMLWKVKDKNQRAKIIEEAGLDVTEEQFYGMLDYCISEPYGFLCVDFQPKKIEQQFRKCFNEFLNPKTFFRETGDNDNVTDNYNVIVNSNELQNKSLHNVLNQYDYT